jgi:L-gamma-glutamyl-L-propargylglycine hydroxylase
MKGPGTSMSVDNLPDVSTTASPIYTLFDLATVDALDRTLLLRLAAGVLGGIHVRNFSSAQECAELVEAIAQCPMGSYDEETVVPRIAKLGPAAYDYYGEHGLTDDYWNAVAEAEKIRSGLGPGDPLAAAVERIAAAWGGPVGPALSGGQDMFAGMIRETNGGMRVHWDEIARELPGALDDLPIAQLAFNWYLSMPESGGDTLVYRHRWDPLDERRREGYGYEEAMVSQRPVVSVRPEAGDVVLFDPRNFHTVRPAQNGSRMSISFFLGITGDGTLRYWS